ncbi:MAG: hypothetical protein ACRD0U_19125 [Acidimicrobiales bacterium]
MLRSLRRRVEHRSSNQRVVTRHARNQLSTAVAFLDWLHERNLALCHCTQGDLDRWLAGPPLRRQARSFPTWAERQGLVAKLSTACTPTTPATLSTPSSVGTSPAGSSTTTTSP